MEFLCEVLVLHFGAKGASDFIGELRDSSTHQYQSCWASFQAFLRSTGASLIGEESVFSYLSFLFHD